MAVVFSVPDTLSLFGKSMQGCISGRYRRGQLNWQSDSHARSYYRMCQIK